MAHIEISQEQLTRLIAKVGAASHANLTVLLRDVGQQQEDAARKRISETRKSPDGVRWKAWSTRYSKTRHAGQSLLVSTGTMRDTLTHQLNVGGKSVQIGSNMEYAATQLYGRGKIPARPFLDTDGGFADPADRDELADLAERWLEDLLS